ncbi:MAG TPA: tetratricopeptide repeat protein [Pyrinomonadaceae bacterium]|nr:tetratricopeptide repeat protein [Pyrinomonadaceae bacterium]
MTPADLLAAADARSQFAAEVMRGEGEIDLARAALLVGAEDEPRRCDVGAGLETLAGYGAEARARVLRAGGREVEALNEYVFGELGFGGNREEYYDPANSLLHRVLEGRKGIPITLSIVYMEVGRRAGLRIEGVALPGHFIVRARAGDAAALVDPFEGRTTDEEECQQRLDSIYSGQLPLSEEHLRPAGTRAILARLLGNLKAIYVHTQLFRQALAAVERTLLLAPHALEERRDRGMLLAQLGRLNEAVVETQSYLNLAPEAPDAAAVREQLNKLRMRLAMLN